MSVGNVVSQLTHPQANVLLSTRIIFIPPELLHAAVTIASSLSVKEITWKN